MIIGRKIFLAFVLAAWACSNAAAGAGRTGGQFLRIIPSPRATAMGGAGTALVDDGMSALSLNPAGLGQLQYSEAGFVYSKWFEDITLQQMYYAHPTKHHGVPAISATLLQVESFEGYDNSGGRAGEVDAGDMLLQAAYGRRLLGPASNKGYGLFGGFSLNYAREKLETVTASTILGDIGLLYSRPMGRGAWSVGYSARSLGRGFQFDSERDPAPTVHRFGLNYDAFVRGAPLSVVYDIRKPVDEDMTHGAGVEYTVNEVLSVLFGYASHQDLGNGLRFGVGFHLKLMTIDYALAGAGEFGLIHRVGVSMRFGVPIDHRPVLTASEEKAQWHVDRGTDRMKKKRYVEAVLEFNKALELDPGNKAALERMRRIRNRLEQKELRR